MPELNREPVTKDWSGKVQRNRLGPMGFVLAFGVVSMLADVAAERPSPYTSPVILLCRAARAAHRAAFYRCP